MTNGEAILVSGVSGMIVGGIGAAVANASRSYPVLKGALAVGAINAVVTAAIIAGRDSARQVQSGVSGTLSAHNPRFL